MILERKVPNLNYWNPKYGNFIPRLDSLAPPADDEVDLEEMKNSVDKIEVVFLFSGAINSSQLIKQIND